MCLTIFMWDFVCLFGVFISNCGKIIFNAYLQTCTLKCGFELPYPTVCNFIFYDYFHLIFTFTVSVLLCIDNVTRNIGYYL